MCSMILRFLHFDVTTVCCADTSEGIAFPPKQSGSVWYFKAFWENAIWGDLLKSQITIYAFLLLFTRNASEVISGILYFYI